MSYELRVTSEASITQLGVRVRCIIKPPENFFEFRTPESESERNVTNYFIIFLLLFLLRIFWKKYFLFEDSNETINNITLILLL